ncbi:MAG TPA: hypothetical protein VMT30_06125 [Candidatus Saccharimonadia bacterium]|nr:hypothetical protein [Candidatus Saccharimonadia bacterium]
MSGHTPHTPRPVPAIPQTKTRSAWLLPSRWLRVLFVAAVIATPGFVGAWFWNQDDTINICHKAHPCPSAPVHPRPTAPPAGCIPPRDTIAVAALTSAPAGSGAASQYLARLKGSLVTEVIYDGPYVTQGQLADEFRTAECNGLRASLVLNQVFDWFPNDEGRISYLKTLDATGNLESFWIDARTAPRNAGDGDSPGSVAAAQWRALLTSAGLEQRIYVLDSFTDRGPEANAVLAKAYEAAGVTYVPLPDTSPGSYEAAGSASFNQAGTRAWAAVSIGGPITSSQLESAVRDLRYGHPVSHILLTTEQDDAGRVRACAGVVEPLLHG